MKGRSFGVTSAVEHFEAKRENVRSALHLEAGLYDSALVPVPKNKEDQELQAAIFRWFMEAIGANKVGGPSYCRFNMRMQMIRQRQKAHGFRTVQTNTDAIGVVLSFVEAIVAHEVGFQE